MKRRGTSRRQVLDLDTSSSSPKRSWQTKYQQIYMDHLNNSAASTAETQVSPAAAQNGSESSESRLPQLVGYTSDSEGDEPKKPAGDIDSKVQDFLKEISDIVPSVASNPDVSSIDDESSRDSFKKSKSKSKKAVGPSLPGSTDAHQPTPVQSSNQQPTIAWQECYDENSGCYYFWNMETNEVTWEMPEALRAYHVALEQWNAQQLLLVQQAGGVAPGFITQSSNQQPHKKQGATKPTEKSKNKRSKPAHSDSEEEKIELITSYGPNSDDDDSDSISSHHSSKKKKVESSKSLKKDKKKEKEIAIGPQLPPGYIAPIEVKETKPAVSETLPSNPEETALIQKESETKKKKKKEVAIKVKSPLEDHIEVDTKDTPINTTRQDINKVNALQRLKNLKNKASDDSSSGDSDASSDSDDSIKDKIKEINKNNEENEEEEEEEDDGVEDSILERLKNQAKILKELGGEIPEEIKELIETNSDSEKDTVPTPPNEKEEPRSGKEIEKKSQKEIKSEGIWPEEEKTDASEDVSEKLIVVHSESSKDTKIINEASEVFEVEIKEVKDLQSTPPTLDVPSEVSKKPPEKAPTSFSLIAGYGNEDDSDPEEEKSEEDKCKVSGKPAPLFPIIPVLEEEKKVDQLENKVEKPSVKNANMKVIKLSAKAKEMIHSSTTTGKARATEFVTTADGLKPASSLVKENEVLGNESRGFPEPLKKVSRKKRLEVPVFRKQEIEPLLKVEAFSKEASSDKKQQETPLNDTRQNVSEEPEEKVEIVLKPSSTAYTSTWAYNSELKGGEYRGFGYGYDYESDLKPKAAKKGMIQFVKADTLMPKTEPVVNLPEKKLSVEGLKQEDEYSSAQKEQTKELAQVITEKVKFLCEGKEVVPPVQVMAIQLETLTTAHSAGGLSVQYLWQWLTSLDGQLASLEQAAAPQGWLCQWDRSYKRYFYRNEATGSIQWEYPEVGATAVVVTEVGAPEPPPPAPAQGGEEAMELCDSPPPPQPPTTPPPPRISASRTPSPSLPDEPAPSLPPLPPPPPVISKQPPLPPLPPSESPPPPPLPPSPPPPPPPPIISIAPGEPLPPGVDMSDEMFEGSRPPLPAVPPPPPTTPPPPPPPPEISGESMDQPVYGLGYDVPMQYDTYQMQPVAVDYSSGVYPYTGTTSGEGDYVIARAPAGNPVPPLATNSLATELDSFYNEVAALDPPPEPSPSPPPPTVSPPPQPQPQLQLQPAVADVTVKKKKKTKLAPGLALKKKGVSSLVAKWQQVQQDVRREAANDETQS